MKLSLKERVKAAQVFLKDPSQWVPGDREILESVTKTLVAFGEKVKGVKDSGAVSLEILASNLKKYLEKNPNLFQDSILVKRIPGPAIRSAVGDYGDSGDKIWMDPCDFTLNLPVPDKDLFEKEIRNPESLCVKAIALAYNQKITDLLIEKVTGSMLVGSEEKQRRISGTRKFETVSSEMSIERLRDLRETQKARGPWSPGRLNIVLSPLQIQGIRESLDEGSLDEFEGWAEGKRDLFEGFKLKLCERLPSMWGCQMGFTYMTNSVMLGIFEPLSLKLKEGKNQTATLVARAVIGVSRVASGQGDWFLVTTGEDLRL